MASMLFDRIDAPVDGDEPISTPAPRLAARVTRSGGSARGRELRWQRDAALRDVETARAGAARLERENAELRRASDALRAELAAAKDAARDAGDLRREAAKFQADAARSAAAADHLRSGRDEAARLRDERAADLERQLEDERRHCAALREELAAARALPPPRDDRSEALAREVDALRTRAEDAEARAGAATIHAAESALEAVGAVACSESLSRQLAQLRAEAAAPAADADRAVAAERERGAAQLRARDEALRRAHADLAALRRRHAELFELVEQRERAGWRGRGGAS